MMFKKSLIVACILCMTLGMTLSCADESSKKIYSENNLSVAVQKKSPEFTIKLKSNPTTGYTWSMGEYDHAVLSLIEHRFVPGNSKLMGAPGFDEWHFRAQPAAFVKPQQTILTFTYARAWEKGEVGKKVVFEVSVK